MSDHHAAPILSRDSAALALGWTCVAAAFSVMPGGPAWPATAVAQAAPNDFTSAPIELEPIDRSELRYNGRSFNEWQREFRTELSPEKRMLALPALAKLGRHGHAAEAAATMAEALDDEEDIELVQAAARHLARLGRAAAPLLVKRLKSGSRDVRLAVIKSLGEIGSLAEAAVPALLPIAAAALGSEVPAVDVVLAEAAFEALKRIISSTTPEVRQGLQSPSPDMRADCIGLIEHSLLTSPAAERQEPVDALLKLLGDGESAVRSAAAVALWRVAADSPKVMYALIAAVRADAANVGRSLAESLYAAARIETDGQTRHALPTALDRHSQGHSEAAVCLLAALLAWPDFEQFADQGAIGLQRKVFHLLALFGPRAAPAVPELARLLKSADAQIRSAAADVLGCIGPQARPAVGLLQEVAGDETPVKSAVLLGASDSPAPYGSLTSIAVEDGSNNDTVGGHVRAALLRIRTTIQ